MKRNVILMGGKTYVLSLPSQWVKKYHVQKGEELDLEERDNSLIICRDSRPQAREIEVDFSALHIMLGRALGGIYKAGYSRAKISFQTKEQLAIIEATLQRTLVGFEIVKQEKNYVLIESLAEIQVKEFDASLKRLFYSLEMMHEDLVSAFHSKQASAFQKVIEKDGQINRLADFCRRVINSQETQSLKKPAVLYYVVEQLERIGDIYKEMAKIASKKKDFFSLETVLFLQEIQTLFVHYRTLFYKFDFEGFESFGKKVYSLREKIADSMQKSPSQGALFSLSHLLETIIDMNGALLTLHL